jgi:hypothetical protein
VPDGHIMLRGNGGQSILFDNEDRNSSTLTPLEPQIRVFIRFRQSLTIMPRALVADKGDGIFWVTVT